MDQPPPNTSRPARVGKNRTLPHLASQYGERANAQRGRSEGRASLCPYSELAGGAVIYRGDEQRGGKAQVKVKGLMRNEGEARAEHRSALYSDLAGGAVVYQGDKQRGVKALVKGKGLMRNEGEAGAEHRSAPTATWWEALSFIDGTSSEAGRRRSRGRRQCGGCATQFPKEDSKGEALSG